MKKKALLGLLAVSVFTLTGCQGKSDDTGNEYAKYVTLGDYSDLNIERIIYTVTDEDVQDEIEGLLYSYAETNEITDRAAQEGDIVNIDYVGKIDGEEFEGGSEEDCEVELGSETFIEGFEEQIVGMEAGETKDITITFPDPYDGELDGKEAVFTITLNEIYELIMPEYNDAFVSEYTDSSTVEEYEAALKEELQEYNDEDSNSMACSDALYEIIETSTFGDYPQELYDLTKSELEASNEETAEMFGLDVTDLFGEDYDIDEATEEAVNEKLVVYAIAAEQGLEVTDDEYAEYVGENYELYGYDSQEEYEEDYSEETTRYELLYDKVLEYLAGVITFTDVSEEEYEDEFDFEYEEDEDEDSEEEDLDPEEVDSLEQEAAEEAEDTES